MDRDELYGRAVGEFVLRERIAGGGFGTIYRCEQPALGREAVVKVLHHRLSGEAIIQQRFLREARLASRLDHPYAAHVYAFGVERDDGLFWIAMEMVHGTTLSRWLDDHDRLPLDQLVPFFERVAEVVHTAHERGIIHRDLKPSNIMMVERAGQILPKLLDFGIAKLLHEAPVLELPAPLPDRNETVTSSTEGDGRALPDRPARVPSGTPPELLPESSRAGITAQGRALTSATLTHANATLGSPPYMSPEQWSNSVNVEPRSDLYALGIIAYEALTGRRPFSADTMIELAELHRTAEVPPVGPELPAALDGLFRRALAKRIEDRFPSALELAEALRVASGLGTPLPSQPAPTPSPRRRWPALGLGAVAIAAVAVAASLMFGPSGGSVAGSVAHHLSDAGQDAAAVIASAPDAAAATPTPPPSVAIRIESTPSGADVLRWPSGVKVGVTPWDGDGERGDGVAVFVISKRGYADRRLEVDLRTGARSLVELSRKAPARPRVPGDVRQPGEPVNPFKDGAP